VLRPHQAQFLLRPRGDWGMLHGVSFHVACRVATPIGSLHPLPWALEAATMIGSRVKA